MRVLVAGANGKTGRVTVARLAGSGREPVAMVRDPAQGDALRELGAFDVVEADLEGDVSNVVEGCDAVVFAAGSGSRTGADKTIRVDLMGAIRLIEACVDRDVRRFVMLSSIRSDDPDAGPEGLRHYLAAKMEADRWLQATDLDWTIVRPGRLTDEPGTGRIQAARRLDDFGEITRDDVAETMVASLGIDATRRKVFDILSGPDPISEALTHL